MNRPLQFILLCLLGFAAQAAPVSFGSLSSDDDGSTELITDTLNGYEWLRWDVLADLDYLSTVAATEAGGAYEGFQLAGITQAQMFIDALLGTPNGCSTADTSFVQCGSGLPDLLPLLGDSFTAGSTVSWFLSDNGQDQQVGYVLFNLTLSEIYKFNEWADLATSDTYSAGNSNGASAIGWLLYREMSPVPLPAAIWLLLSGLAGLGLVRAKHSGRSI